MDGGATPRPSPLLWPRAPLTQCRKVQAVKGERPLAVPVGAAHLLGGPGPQGFRESSASNACGVEPREGGAACLHPRGGVWGGGEGGVVCAGQRGQRTGCPVRICPSLSLPPPFCRVSADVVTRAPSPLGRYLYYLSASPPAVPPYYHLVLPFSHCYTASDLRPAETTRRT